MRIGSEGDCFYTTLAHRSELGGFKEARGSDVRPSLQNSKKHYHYTTAQVQAAGRSGSVFRHRPFKNKVAVFSEGCRTTQKTNSSKFYIYSCKTD